MKYTAVGGYYACESPSLYTNATHRICAKGLLTLPGDDCCHMPVLNEYGDAEYRATAVVRTAIAGTTIGGIPAVSDFPLSTNIVSAASCRLE